MLILCLIWYFRIENFSETNYDNITNFFPYNKVKESIKSKLPLLLLGFFFTDVRWGKTQEN